MERVIATLTQTAQRNANNFTETEPIQYSQECIDELLNALHALKAEYQEYQRQTSNAWGLQNTKAEEIYYSTIKKYTK